MTTPAAALRRVTVMRAGALGDTLLTLPTLALLREAAPGAHLTFIARADTLPLAHASGLADVVWPWDLPDWGVIFATPEATPPLTERAREALAQADAVILWAPDDDDAIARRLTSLGATRAIVAPASPPAEALGEPHTAVWLAEALRPFGIEIPATRDALTAHLSPLRPPASSQEQAEVHWRRWGLAPRVVALHPGSGSPAKCWPAERFAEVARLANDAGYQPLLLAGEADAPALAATRVALASRDVSVASAQGLPLEVVAALMARCAGYVGSDSGLAHLAGMLGTPTVAVFGPTDPARWSPLGPRVRTLRAADARLDHLPAEEVWAALRTLLAAVAPE